MRVREANAVLDEVGLGSTRVMIKQTADSDKESYIEAIEELLEQTERLGPNPVKGTDK